MSVINKPPQIVERKYQLEDLVADAAEQYAGWIGSTPDHVVNSAVKMMLWRDKGFLAWRKAIPNWECLSQSNGSAGNTRARRAFLFLQSLLVHDPLHRVFDSAIWAVCFWSHGPQENPGGQIASLS